MCVRASVGPMPTVELRIDELARRASMTVRNVRAYQDRGLIPPPERRGRVAIYTEVHLLRLRVVGQLLDRGYNLTNIAELLQAWERGENVGEAMGLEAVLSSPWSTEQATYATMAELAERFGVIGPSTLRRAIELGYLEPDGSRFRVPSPQLLSVAEELVQVGIPLDAILDEAEQLHARVAAIADGFAQLVVEHLFDKYGDDALPPPGERAQLAAVIARLRPLARTAVDGHLARALEKAVHEGLGEQLAKMLERDDE